MKKVAILGNMNNNFIALTRYLRDAGLDTHLFFLPIADHFRPIADSFVPLENYLHEVDWLNNGFHSINESKIQEQLSEFNFFIGQGIEAVIAYKCGFQMDIYFPYGSDFYKFSWLKQDYSLIQILYILCFKGGRYRDLRRGTQSKFNRQVIQYAKNVFLDYTNPEYENKLLDLGLKGKFSHSALPFLYLPQYQNRLNWDVHWKSIIDTIRQSHDFLIVYHGRHEWMNSKSYNLNDFTTKNTNFLIEGFASFIKANPTVSAALVTIEYGGDVVNSKKLINDLCIGNNVYWLPKMYRKDLMYLLANADLGSGEFGRSYLTFGTIIEAMSMGVPVVHYRDDNLYNQYYPELYPLYNAREPEQIADVLQRAYDFPEERKEKGLSAMEWVKTYFIEHPLKNILTVINEL